MLSPERDRDRVIIPWRDRNASIYDDRERERERERDRNRDRRPYAPNLPPNPYARRSRSPPLPLAPAGVTTGPMRYRSLSPERDRDRDRERPRHASGSGSGCGGGITRYRHADSPEPGQILPRQRDWSRSPPRPARPYAPKRSRSRSPDVTASTAEALRSFSSSMQSTLISSSVHSLALQHFTRLAKFPHTNPTSEHFEAAQTRVAEAEKALNEQMIKLQSSFAELIKRTMSKPGVGVGDISGLEIDALKERMVRLEEIGKGVARVAPAPAAPAPAPSGSVLPPPPTEPAPSLPPSSPYTPTFPQYQYPAVQPYPPAPSAQPSVLQPTDDPHAPKRQRLREMLDDLVSRLESVESMRDGFEERCNDLENQIDAWVGADMDKVYTSSWEHLEERRDPSGRLRGLEQEKGKEKEQSIEVELQGEGQSRSEGHSVGNEEVLALRRELRPLQERVDAASAPAAAPATPISMDEIAPLRADNKRLDDELKALRAEPEVDNALIQHVARLRAEVQSITQARAADMTSATLTSVSTHVGRLQTTAKALDESRATQDSRIAALLSQVGGLQDEIKELRGEMKAMNDGRDQWTRDVMSACLSSVKEESQDEYAKIAKREIQSYVRDFMAKRGGAMKSRTTPEPSVSPAGPPSQLPIANQPQAPAQAETQPSKPSLPPHPSPLTQPAPIPHPQAQLPVRSAQPAQPTASLPPNAASYPAIAPYPNISSQPHLPQQAQHPPRPIPTYPTANAPPINPIQQSPTEPQRYISNSDTNATAPSSQLAARISHPAPPPRPLSARMTSTGAIPIPGTISPAPGSLSINGGAAQPLDLKARLSNPAPTSSWVPNGIKGNGGANGNVSGNGERMDVDGVHRS